MIRTQGQIQIRRRGLYWVVFSLRRPGVRGYGHTLGRALAAYAVALGARAATHWERAL